MLKLVDIKKDYIMGKEGKKDYQKTEALKGISLEFRKSEFVSILGQSGCGKTTLLNIIGGLDNYTSGDLIINGKSTKLYKDRDWDNYRNHSIGFVFQSYNLIPHQTVLQNVELALTLSGISKSERKERAIKILEKVGLKDKLKSKPNQLSGGQMQRVAIARALINDPDIILADEPTGALDSKTSVQIMDILKEISKEKLIIMVTHNPEIAQNYSNRIIKLLDGLVIDDSNPFDSSAISENLPELNIDTIVEEKEEEIAVDEQNIENDSNKNLKKQNKKRKKSEKDTKIKSMSIFTAISLSLNNLLTKKARTFLVAFAGSIGIIGIALILSISNGIQLYINKVQEDTLSAYPITLETTTNDYSGLLGAMVETSENERDLDSNTIYVDDSMTSMVNSMQQSIKTNDLKSFNDYLNQNYSEIEDAVNAISYTYNFDMQIYSSDGKTRINPTTIFENMGESFASMSAFSSYMAVFQEMLDNDELLSTQYDVLAVSEGKNKKNLFKDLAYNEIVLVLDKSNQISNMALYMLGIKDQSELEDTMNDILAGNKVESASGETYTFEEFLNMTFKVVLRTEFFEKNTGISDIYLSNSKTYNTWKDTYEDLNDIELENFVKTHGQELKIVGIIRPNEEAVSHSINGIIGYSSALTQHIMALTNQSEIVKQQKETPDYDVLTGLEFEKITSDDIDLWWNGLSNDDKEYVIKTLNLGDSFDYNQLGQSKKINTFGKYATTTVQEIDAVYYMQKDIIDSMLDKQGLSYATMTDIQKILLFANYIPSTTNTYEKNLELFQSVNPEVPYTINIYAKDFNSKEKITDFIVSYNKNVGEEKEIIYTDLVGLLMNSITTIVNAISYVLIAFVSVSLVVSSIMIGIITYISVLERIKEIGVLRSIGASKKDIKRVFTSESVIIGFTSGMVGIIITLILTIPINIIIKALANISNVASLPFAGAVILILISMLLTFIAGLVPAQIASKKDPVKALRTE